MSGFMEKLLCIRGLRVGLSVAALMLAATAGRVDAKDPPAPKGKWMAGDFHQHTYYTDGSNTFDFVMDKNVEFGLDWWANSEHGGSRNRDGNGALVSSRRRHSEKETARISHMAPTR